MDIVAQFSHFLYTETDTVLEVLLSPNRIKVARRPNMHAEWVITPEGEELLASHPAPVVESVDTLASIVKPKRKAKAKVDDDLNLDDL